MDALCAIFSRRSIGRLVDPAPTPDDLATILRGAAAAPDHGQLRPFRFTVLDGSAREAFGQVLEDAYLERCAEAGRDPQPARAAKERSKLRRAPLVLVISAVRTDATRIPAVEQRDAAVAALQNALIAATALGYGSMWRTGEPVTDPRVKRALGLGVKDAIVGFLYLGTTPGGARESCRRPEIDDVMLPFLRPDATVADD